MRKGQAQQGNVVSFPRALAPSATADHGVAAVVKLLQEQLRHAHEGKLRSIAIASVSADGASIETQCSCADGDVADLVGTLNVLAREMMAARIN